MHSMSLPDFPGGFRRRSSGVEQLIRNERVAGSNPAVGSNACPAFPFRRPAPIAWKFQWFCRWSIGSHAVLDVYGVVANESGQENRLIMKLKAAASIIVLVLLSLSSCKKEEPVVEEVSTPEPTPVATPTPTPAPTPEPTPEATPEPTQEPVVEHSYYLKRRISVSTDTGLMGFDAGTEVELLFENAGRATVAIGDTEFEVETSDLTTDLTSLSEILAKQDAAAAERIRMQKEKLEMEKARREQVYEERAAAVATQTARMNVAAMQQRLSQLSIQIEQITARRTQLEYDLRKFKDPAAVPEGRAKLQEYRQIPQTLRKLRNEEYQLKRQIRQASLK